MANSLVTQIGGEPRGFSEKDIADFMLSGAAVMVRGRYKAVRKDGRVIVSVRKEKRK